MTVPGVYNPAQAAAHARRVARDEDDVEAREVEVMARAMCGAQPNMIRLKAINPSVWLTEIGFRWREFLPEAESARNALIAFREGGE